ncbi:MAG TPA: acetyl-CoA decarbonylase/synthase complex subunit gamma [Spirochaetota bacterium]|nr:acetyl-CoA decarbonylase/synthase complex subunit gamma [Spirochaetota bacterium]HOD14475.1 acetyl-CoA decarbonylase/synthase complex subunit gamma [Spirochaetota bacterium]HPN13463.1 acetyl-CoA decarbonylase/synthase complex subunit gamma [Spirochaetota bacterium]HQL81061.1 acetyl-CoA decarbonylase/synthase complex subunit gamma [Spirochaetota bacterium]
MGMTGIEIYKLLPQTNCGDCGVPTCLAFAMKLAAGQAELSRCPHVSAESRAKLESASAPPVLPVTIGQFKTGGETVLFRHEKTFVSPTGIAVLVTDAMSDGDIAGRLERFAGLRYERVGVQLAADLIAVRSEKGDAAAFEKLVQKAAATDAGLILMSEDPAVLAAGLKHAAAKKPLLYAATKANADAVGKLALDNMCPVAVKGSGMDEVIELTQKLSGMGLKEIVIDTGSRGMKQAFEDQVVIRRAAVKGGVRALGYPTIAFPCDMAKDPMEEALIASTFIAKYAGIVVLSDLKGESLFPLLVERMNIFTDPQRPMATEQGIYPINNPDENSPVLITTNFSLTYFIVSGEIEGSRMPAWLLIMDCEGLSVLTAWAAGKFVADAIGSFVKKCGIADKVKHRSLVIPGYSASISGELEEELADWKITIGPREAAHIPAFMKQYTV